MTGHWLTIKETCLDLGVSEKTVRRYIGKGLLEAKKTEGKYFISEQSIRHFDQVKEGSLDINMSNFDPTKHLVIERQEYQGLLVRLGQLEAENKFLKDNEQKLIEDRRSWWRKLFNR
jgi:hypothetical protein